MKLYVIALAPGGHLGIARFGQIAVPLGMNEARSGFILANNTSSESVLG